MRFLILVPLMLITACSSGSFKAPDIETVKLYPYSAAFQTQAKAELATIPAQTCARDVPVQPCSAVRQMIVDYKTDRDQIRALMAQETPPS